MINEWKFSAMGTTVEFLIPNRDTAEDADGGIHNGIEEILNCAKNKVLELESRLSRFRDASELNEVNRMPGQWVSISPILFEILRHSKRAFVDSRGLFNPCLGGLLEGMGYHISFEKIGPLVVDMPNASSPTPYITPMHCPYELDDIQMKVYLEYGFKIDLGGIAKGWIVKQAAQTLEFGGITQYLCNAGGDIICRGRNGDVPWCISVSNPLDDDQSVVLDLSDLSMATSGTYRRTWLKDGETINHIIDPFFGKSTQSDVISCTVICPDLVQAEVFAKVGLLLGSTLGRTWLARQDINGWVMINKSGEVVQSWS